MNKHLRYFISLYFEKFSVSEKIYFRGVISDLQLISTIQLLTDLFTFYSFYDKRIIEETSHIDKIEKITELQRCYYESVYDEHDKLQRETKAFINSNNDVIEVYKTLESKNSSFQYLIKLKNALLLDIERLEKDDFEVLRNLFTITAYENLDKDFLDNSNAEQSTIVDNFQINKIKNRAQNSFAEMKKRRENFEG